MKSQSTKIFMEWDDINSIIDDLKDVMDGMDKKSPDFNEFKVSIARAIASLRAEKISREAEHPPSILDRSRSSTRIEYVKTIADARLREELKAVFDF